MEWGGKGKEGGGVEARALSRESVFTKESVCVCARAHCKTFRILYLNGHWVGGCGM